MHEALARHLYWNIQRARREPVQATLGKRMHSQYWSADQLADYQGQQLRQLLTHARERCPYYRQAFEAAGLNTETAEIADLQKVPLLEKQDLQLHGDTLRATMWAGPVSVEATSGSTGTPLALPIDRHAGAAFRAVMYREHAWFGLGVGAREARFYGLPLSEPAWRRERWKDRLMNRIRISAYQLDEGALARHWQRICRFRPAYFYGYTSVIVRLSAFLQQQAIDSRGLGLQAVIVTSELLHPSERTLLETTWGCPVVNEYGCSEAGIIAHECEHGSMHLMAENAIVEFLRDGQPAQEGEPAEIVVTSLVNQALPLIRYRIGDVGAWSAKPCPCGRHLPRMEMVAGRLNHMVVGPNGTMSSGFLFYYLAKELLAQNGQLRRFVIHQYEPGALVFEFPLGDPLSEDLKANIRQQIEARLGQAAVLTFRQVEEIPALPSGKHLHFISHLALDLAGHQVFE